MWLQSLANTLVLLAALALVLRGAEFLVDRLSAALTSVEDEVRHVGRRCHLRSRSTSPTRSSSTGSMVRAQAP